MGSEDDLEVFFRELLRRWNTSPRPRAMLLLGRMIGLSCCVGLFGDLIPGGGVLTMYMVNVLPTVPFEFVRGDVFSFHDDLHAAAGRRRGS